MGQMGNQLFYYNNLVQIANKFNHDFKSPNFTNNDLFNLISPLENTQHLVFDEIISFKDLINDNLILEENKTYLLDVCLYELFFKFDNLSTFDIFNLKENTIDNSIKTAIHFRGTDFKIWDPNSQLKSSYYINSIDLILNENNDNHYFTIHTDDTSLLSYNEVISYLKNKNQNFITNEANSNKADFIQIANSDFVISSPSTFCITASMCGKKNKKIIHNNEWIEYKINSDYFRDIFWKDLNNGGNKDYKIWKKV